MATSSPTETMSSYESKLHRAWKLLNDITGLKYKLRYIKVEENGNPEDGPQAGPKPTFDEFKSAMESYGAYTDAALKELKWEDLERLGVPPLLARQIANEILRVSAPKVEHKSPRAVTYMDDFALVESYDPELPNSRVAKELGGRYSGVSILVFKVDGNTVDVDETMRQIGLVQRRLPVPDFLQDGRKTYVVGDGPSRMVEVCPIHTGEVLINGFCHRCCIVWGDVAIPTRQIVYFANRRSLVDSNRMQLLDLVSKLQQSPGEVSLVLNMLYPEAVTDYFEAERKGELPTLKSKIEGGCGGNPFGKPKRY